jgi:hypothetical protein
MFSPILEGMSQSMTVEKTDRYADVQTILALKGRTSGASGGIITLHSLAIYFNTHIILRIIR